MATKMIRFFVRHEVRNSSRIGGDDRQPRDHAFNERIRSIVDVGGGKGALLTKILKACPQASGVLFDLPETEPQCEHAIIAIFQRVVPMAVVDIDMPHLDIMLTRIAHNLGRRIKAHRL